MIRFFKELKDIEGSMYVEFQRGKGERRLWDKNSKYIDSDTFEMLLPIFIETRKDFDMFSPNKFQYEELNKLLENIQLYKQKTLNRTNSVDYIDLSGGYLSYEEWVDSIDVLLKELEDWVKETIECRENIYVLGI